ncbi:MAG: cobalamin transport system substrate-binding protein [Candidatus Methanomethylophilaceae archaeon]|nr:cobalamin transport system substrate-binding protein [Candidatus Methanomethylophilaceae archaeon]
MSRKVLVALVVAILLFGAPVAIYKVMNAEPFKVDAEDIVHGEAPTIRIYDAKIGDAKIRDINGAKEVTVTVGDRTYPVILDFNKGEAVFEVSDSIDDVGVYTVSVEIDNVTKTTTLNVFLFTIYDDIGKVGFFDYPEKIVSLGKAFTDTLFYLEKGENIIAVDGYSKELNKTYPSLDNITNLGSSASSWNTEEIAEMDLDLVIMYHYTWGSYPQVREQLESFGVKVAAFYPKSYQEVMDMVLTFGNMLNCSDKAQDIYDAMNTTRTTIANAVSDIPQDERLRVYAELRNKKTVNEGSLMHELITMAGGVNVAQNPDLGSTYEAEGEWVSLQNVSVVVVENAHPDNNETILERCFLDSNTPVHRLTDDTYLNYSPSLEKGLLEIAGFFHEIRPDPYPDPENI